MRFNKIGLLIVAAALFIAGCNQTQTETAGGNEPFRSDIPNGEIIDEQNPYVARENLDLRRVGNLLERADNAEEFEYLLNSEDGINNLDLNGDGYADYIGVSEFDNGDGNQRGFALFDRFGADEIQEIARIIFDRNSLDDPGARLLTIGNDQIYGDNNYYETNWLERSLPIARWIFSRRDNNYESPYYYNNYPEYYEPYQIVETPVYRTRIEEYYPQPVFIQTSNPAITNIKIKSKYQDRSINNIYAGLAKPTREQINFKKGNPKKPEFVEIKKEKIKDVPAKYKEKFKDLPNIKNKDFDKPGRGKDKNADAKNNPLKIERENFKPQKPDKAEKQMMRQNERQNMKPNKPEQPMPRMDKPNKPDNPGKGNGGGNGGGKGNGGNGGGHGKGNGGGGKGKGKG